MVSHKVKACIRPIGLSALSFFLSFFLIQPVALLLDSTFSLLANRGVGKIGLTSLVFIHIAFLLYSQSQTFCTGWYHKNIGFFKTTIWIWTFLQSFTIFFLLHWGILIFASLQAQLSFQIEISRLLSISMVARLTFGFFVTFLLAWSEELIFRGTFFPYFKQYMHPLTGILITSTIFMLVHNLTNPLILITSQWKLGLGLFLLGMLLNIVYHITDTLYIGMGIHAGLVFVKVILRRLPFVIYTPSPAWWFHQDLRQAAFVHILFLITIIILLLFYWQHYFTSANRKTIDSNIIKPS